MTYDIIIIGAGAAGLFAGINLPKDLNKLILEKNDKPGIKVLLSGGERANVSNMDIEPMRDYFTQNKKALLSVFKKYNQWDIMSFFAANGVNIVEEDRGRLILESGDSKELLAVLLREVKKNNCEIRLNSDVKKVIPLIQNADHTGNRPPPNPLLRFNFENSRASTPVSLILGKAGEQYEIVLENGEKYHTKNVIVSSGGKSFFQVGTTGEGYNIAESLGINVIAPHRSLCGLTTKKDLSELSGSSINLLLKLKDIVFINRDIKKDEIIYQEFGPLLFTHFGISGPIVFNTGNALGEYLNKLKIYSEDDKIRYILENIKIELEIDALNSTKKINKYFEKEIENSLKIEFGLQDWRSWKEAKATGGGIDLNELDKNMQSKKYPGLYFIGEVVDVTGKTGGFNLQWAWSSAFVCSENFK
ncbi:MAG: NAD(P)/FAD-dependent oxidoreductase [Candidatus Gracilibacteria bacterium]|nr:NAD(P)/FAD-dependent oxidoreductase [Candidatus Gracilibacteria bacterium]